MPDAAIPVPLPELLAMAQDYERAGRSEVSSRIADHILASLPEHGEALHLAGLAAHRQGDSARAAGLIERALATGLEVPLYLRNLCEVYRVLGRLDEALAAARRATQLDPLDPLCLHNQCIVHYHRLELGEALDCAARALSLMPELAGAHFGRAEALLLRGDWAAGWESYEWRFRVAGTTKLIPAEHMRAGVPHWDGTPLDGKTLLLVADQGFGDVIQFSRYIPWAEARCPELLIAGSRETHGLLRQLSPRAVLTDRWSDMPPYAAYCPLSGLPRLHGTRVDTVPAEVPYLRAPPAHAARWAARLDALIPRGLRRVGLVWAGRPTHGNDRSRSLRLEDLRPITAVPGTALLTVQKGPTTDQVARYVGRTPLFNLGAEIADYDDTMAILANLDVVVTVDTSVAHLAGAMGRPVWIMLPRAPDWRWLLDRADSPWYPTARLFRRRAGQAWTEVAADVAAALAASIPREGAVR